MSTTGAGDTTPPVVSILIVTYRQHALFGRCIDALRGHPPSIPHEIIVVVNGEAQPEHAAAGVAGATVIYAPRNLGLAGGLHAARNAARGKYLMLLQDDVEVCPGWLEPLVDVVERDESVGAVVCRVELIDGGLQQEGRLVWQRAFMTNLGDPEVPGPCRPVDAGGTSALLVRAAAWDSVGGVDLGLYPSMFVDIDLALSLAETGWNVMVEPRAVVLHGLSKSTPSKLRGYLIARHRRRVVRRHVQQLESRPRYSDSPSAIAEALERCRVSADARRESRTFEIPSAPTPRLTVEQLARQARRQAVVFRIGFALWPVRLFLWRCRERLRKAGRRR